MCNNSPQFSWSFVLIQQCLGSQTDKIAEYLGPLGEPMQAQSGIQFSSGLS